jgi:hypothetical protein
LIAHSVPAQPDFNPNPFMVSPSEALAGVGRNTLGSRSGGTFNLQFWAKFSNVLNLLGFNTPNRAAFAFATEVLLPKAGVPLYSCLKMRGFAGRAISRTLLAARAR